MKCYIVVDESENRIVKVKDDDIESFKKEYADKILLEADNVQELLIKLSEKLNGDEAGLFQSVLHH